MASPLQWRCHNWGSSRRRNQYRGRRGTKIFWREESWGNPRNSRIPCATSSHNPWWCWRTNSWHERRSDIIAELDEMMLSRIFRLPYSSDKFLSFIHVAPLIWKSGLTNVQPCSTSAPLISIFDISHFLFNLLHPRHSVGLKPISLCFFRIRNYG